MMRTILIVILLSIAPSLWAHCDSLKGPVVVTARLALEKGDVTPVLKWVRAADEQEIRDAFADTLKARAQGPEAKAIADRWFFETLVRIHRSGEGAAFSGLKGADYQPEEGIELADSAIESGSLDATQQAIVAAVTHGLQQRYNEVQETKRHANESVEAGRRYVHAYVEFIHFVERLHENASTSAGHHAVAER